MTIQIYIGYADDNRAFLRTNDVQYFHFPNKSIQIAKKTEIHCTSTSLEILYVQNHTKMGSIITKIAML